MQNTTTYSSSRLKGAPTTTFHHVCLTSTLVLRRFHHHHKVNGHSSVAQGVKNGQAVGHSQPDFRSTAARTQRGQGLKDICRVLETREIFGSSGGPFPSGRGGARQATPFSGVETNFFWRLQGHKEPEATSFLSKRRDHFGGSSRGQQQPARFSLKGWEKAFLTVDFFSEAQSTTVVPL